MIEQVEKWLINSFLELNFSEFYAEVSAVFILIVILLIFGIIVDRLSRKVLLNSFARIASRSKTHWDDLLIKHKVITAIAHLAPVLFIFYFLPQIFKEYETVVDYVNRLSEIVLILTSLVVIFRFLNLVREILSEIPLFKDKPLQSYFQLIKIVIGIIMGVLILSIIANKSIMYFFGAFGAISAVLLLVFKDTILGFIASIQLAANDMIRVGDWVQMDKYGADGNVIEINLATVKVKNWDKTITTVPTYSFISDSFKNWRGMEETGARRIARSIFINQQSVKFCNEEMLERFKRIHVLKGYVEEKEAEIEAYNKERKVDVSQVSNGRRMTNLGTFRAYLLRYLKNHPKINQDLTLLVRQLEPTSNGIPIQVYAFCKDTEWVKYEAVQSDIFDHILAVVPQFELEVFQNPSGSDFRGVLNR